MPLRIDRDQHQWGSRTRYPDGHLRPFTLDKLVLHWGGYTDPDGPDNVPTEAEEAAILRGWQRYHIDSKGWTDIAYNYAMGNTGLVYRLRGMNRSGATSGDLEPDGIRENYEALSLVWIGGSGHDVSDAAFAAMGRAIRDLIAEHGDLPVTVHSDHKATACPGDEWRAWVARRGWETESTTPTQPPTEETDVELRTVRYGDGSKAAPDAAVAAAQRGMTIHGFRDSNTIDAACGADGIFRSGTERQVKDFQQASGLVIDGIVGPATWEKILG